MTTTCDAEWDEQTREAALSLALYEESLCPLCGHPRHVCQDPAHQFDWVVPQPIRCHASTALMQRQQAITEDTNPQHRALLWGVHLSESGD